VLEQVAWKYKHPATDEELAQRVTVKGGVAYASAQPGYEYERVVRYNYSRDELSVLVDSLSLVKALASMLTNAEAVLAPVLRAAMHKEVQSFLVSQTQAPGLTGEGVLTLLHRADKRKRPVKAALLQLRTMGADWFNDVEPVEEYKKKRAEREAAEATRRHKPRALAPSPTQLFLLRAAVETLASDRAPGMQGKGLLSKKDFDKEEVGWLMGFWKSTYFFPYLLDLGGTVQVCADMGDLWYREFYLEMTKQVQFPIDMSLPWILTEHVINNPVALTSHMVENILFAMDIYNDSAHRALNSLHQQYLFQEIEAEVNLCFDQLVFLTSENVYRYYKDVAATRRLDQDFAAEMQAMSGKRHLEANKRRFEVPLLQRHVQLLGRSVDLGEGIGQMLQMKLVADLEMALRRLEAADLGFIVEFESLVATLKATHSLLVEEGCGGLDSWEATWAAANDEVSPGAFRGRLALHAVRVVVFDLVPAYSFAVSTQRFVRSPIRMNAPLDLDSAPRKVPPGFGFGDACKSAYEDAHRLHREFVGVPHVEALCRALGHSGQSVLVDALLAHVRSTLENISPYMAALATLLPPCKLPKFVYRAAGCYGFFEGKLKGVLGYSDLKSTVFQVRSQAKSSPPTHPPSRYSAAPLPPGCLRVLARSLSLSHFVSPTASLCSARARRMLAAPSPSVSWATPLRCSA
jgi:cytoplasmic FMR1 interacting protein